MKNITLFTFFLVNILFLFSSRPVFAVEKYTMRQRFGVGFDQHNGNFATRNINEFAYQQLGLGWYFDWGMGMSDSGGPTGGLEYLGLVGGWTKNIDISATCLELGNYIRSNQNKYPDGMLWTVGNEIGFDDGRTPQEYANDFISWYSCLKSINSTFKVGTGAIISPYWSLAPVQSGCVTSDNTYSGLSYFRNYLNILKSQNKIPDFIVNHAYGLCNNSGGWGDWADVNNFVLSIRLYRSVMKELNLQDKDLIINEFSPTWTQDKSLTNVSTYMQGTVNYMATAKDPAIGNPQDDYRLVQRWAWYVFNSWKNSPDPNNSHPWVELFDTVSLNIKPLGSVYKNLISNYSPIDVSDFRQLLSAFTSIFNYNQLVRNFGRPSP